MNDHLAAADVEDRSIKAIDQMVDLFTVVIAVFITLYIWGVDEMIYAALTTIGVVGVMLGFAVKDIGAASEALREAGEKEPRRLEDEAVTVLIKEFEASTVKFELRFWVGSEDLTSVKSDVHGEIRRALAERSIVQDISTTVVTGGGGP